MILEKITILGQTGMVIFFSNNAVCIKIQP